MKAIIDSIVERWDWFIYYRAHHSLRRMCERNAGFAYLFELNIQEWRDRNPISEELKRATEEFYREMGKGGLK